MKGDFLAEKMLASEIDKISELEKILKDYSSNNKLIVSKAFEKKLINKKSLLDFIENNNEYTSLKIYDFMTDQEKLEKLISFENLGEILLRKKKIKIEQLIEVLSDLEIDPNKTLEDVLLSKSLVNHQDIYEALEFQMNQESLVKSLFNQVIDDLSKINKFKRKIVIFGDNYIENINVANDIKNETKDFDLVIIQDLVNLKNHDFDLILFNFSNFKQNHLKKINNLYFMINKKPSILLTCSIDKSDLEKLSSIGITDCLLKNEISIKQIIYSIELSFSRNTYIEEIKNLTIIDELTGLYNRRGFSKLSRNLFFESVKTSKKLDLLFIDINNMKKINDNFGHNNGDKAIKIVSNSLKKSFEKNSVISRIGGDEFLVLFNSNEDIRDRLKKLNSNLNDIQQRNEIPLKISISIGISSKRFNNSNNIHLKMKNMINSADDCLNKSKKKSEFDYLSYSKVNLDSKKSSLLI